MVRTYKPREWPYRAKAARDGAAEEIAAALIAIMPVLRNAGNIEETKKLAVTVYHLQNALRHLEAVGAKTVPREL